MAKQPLKQRIFTHAKQLIWTLSPALLDSLLKPQHPQTFSIGVVYGASPFDLGDRSRSVNPVLRAQDVKDAPAGFVADPFMVNHSDTWYMFMEVYDRILRRGRIGLATTTDCQSWKYQKLILKEDFHLAYPQVLKWHDTFFMVPDSPGEGVRLYQSIDFPVRWRFERTLIDDPNIVDPTIFTHDGHWWLLAGWQDPDSSNMSLRLYHAPELMGSWVEHPASPVVSSNNTIGRPAGSVVKYNGRLIRFAQDGNPEYGSRVHAMEILQLTTTTYEERKASSKAVLDAGSDGWNSGGMHHICAHCVAEDKWIACVDGWFRSDEL